MDLKELRSIIKNSNSFSFLNEIEVDLNFPQINETYKIVGVYNLYKFLTEQKSGWLSISLENYGNSFTDSLNFFITALNQLDYFLNTYVSNASYSTENITHYFNQTVSQHLIPSNVVLIYNSSTVDFLINVYNKDVELFKPAFNYTTGNGINPTTKNNLYGYFLAYEFENKENSFLFNKRESEKRSFNSLRSELISLGDNYNNEVSTFIKKVEEDYQENTRLQNKKIEESRSLLAKWLLHNRSNFNEFLGTTTTEFSNLFANTKEEFNNELGQYAKLLELQEPIKYWQIRATELNEKANDLLKCIVGISVFFAILVYVLLWFTPEGLLESIFSGDKAKAIRWSFVFIIFISIFFVIIRALLKFMFSNFHLARDAEEREKLTYLYISLLSKGDVSEEERKIVFQALFSRSDTGLLKEDSSPTMPGVASIIEKMK